MSFATTKPRYKIIDADTHYTEPHDLWTKRAPAALKDRVPQVKMLNGEPAWVIDRDVLIGFGANPCSTVLKNGGKVRSMEGFFGVTFDDVHPSSYEVKARLAVMDDSGVYAHITYPNVLGFGGSRASTIDPDLRLTTIYMFNDAMAEVQSDSGERIFPMAIVPWWDLKAAVAEVERVAKLGLRGITMGSDPQEQTDRHGVQLPDLSQAFWNPLWEACQSLNMPINFHIGANDSSSEWIGKQGWPALPVDLKSGLGSIMASLSNGRVIGNIIYSGLLDRYPKLQFVSVESGIGWMPFLLEGLDYQLDEIADRYKFDMRPSEYFKRNFLGCFWFEQKHLAYNVRAVGVDNCMFETDFPHPTSLFPTGDIEARLIGLTDEEKAKILSLNAARVYRIAVT